MEQIVVNRAGGGTLNLFSREPYCSVTKASQKQGLLADDVLTLSVETAVPLPFTIGDRILAFGTEYTLNLLPAAKKRAQQKFEYELTFEGPQYSLLRLLYFDIDATGVSTGAEFSLTGDLRLFVGVLMNNLARGLPGWLLGAVPEGTPVKDLSFSSENCLAVLQKLCTEFGTEFSIRRSGDGKHELSFGPVGQVIPQTFRYGRGNGLYELSRSSLSDKNFFTRLYAFGGTKNIASTYRNYSPRLKLPASMGEGSYLENAGAREAFGLIEASKLFDDIYPQRTGRISAVNGLLSFTDETMDFDLNEIVPGSTRQEKGKTVSDTRYLIAGVTAKVHMNTGKLAGYEFQIGSYDHTAKTFALLAFQDERGQSFPATGAFEFSVGDTYVLLDINMPQSYIDKAEAELLTAAQAYLNQNLYPRVQYSLSVTGSYLIDRADRGALTNFFAVGDYLQIQDPELEIDRASRVIGLERDLIRPYQYKLEIADTYQITRLERIIAQQAELDTIVRLNGLTTDPARARTGWRNTQELLSVIFDPDGYFDGGRIKPESIETGMLVVGAKSQQLILNCVIEPNYEGNANVVRVNAGTLTHYTVEETIRTWPIAAATTTITDSAFRYIYARCNRMDSSDGSILFSGLQIKPDDNANYYTFLLGVLHTVDPDTHVRWINLTYGATSINGRFIKTGRIQSADGGTYFDLDSGEIRGKITFLASDGSPLDVGALTKTVIDGGLVTTGGLRLAGEDGTVRAGITGGGSGDTAVRVWAGSTYDNRDMAPFRVLQSGEVFARKRIEMMNQANVGQAGLAGANVAADGTTRIWAGSAYAGRATAPFRVDASGAMTATAGYIGSWQIAGGGIVNFDGQAYVIARNNTTAFRTEARIGSQIFPATSGLKGAAFITATEKDDVTPNIAIYAEAANGGRFLGDDRGFGVNYALYAPRGKAMLSEGLFNGRGYYGRSISDVNLIVDPSLYDVIELYPAGNSAGLKFKTDGLVNKLYPGKTITIINCHDTNSNLFLIDILRGNGQYKIEGGCACTIMMGAGGYWYQLSYWDNNWGESPAPVWPVPDTTGGTDPNGGRLPATNPAPTLATPIPDQSFTSNATLTYVVPAGTFSDTDALTYSATMANGSAFPAGLLFDGNSRTFTFSDALAAGSYELTVTATDTASQTVSDTFTVAISRTTTPPGGGGGGDTPTVPGGTNTYSGQNVSEAGSTNTFIMDLESYIDSDGMMGVREKATGGVDGQRWYLLPGRDGGGQGETGSYYTKEQMEADRWPQGRYHVFICLVMQGTPSDDKHRDGPYHAEQRIMYL